MVMTGRWKFTPYYVEFFLVILLAWLITGWWHTGEVVQKIAPLPEKTKKHLSMISALTSVALFGVPPERAEVASKPVSKPVVKSQLRLTLVGTVLAGKRSAAIVMLGGGSKQHVFILGDTIQNGVVLKKVEASAIVVSYQGRLERIVLKRGKALNVAAAIVPTESLKATHTLLSRKYIHKKVQDFPKLLSQARVLPYFKNGKPDGFVITDIVPGSLYQTVGLQNGDILRKVNGVTITGAKQAMAMYQKLQNASSIDLELLRHGTLMPIHYRIK